MSLLLVSCQSANRAASRPADQPPSVSIQPAAALEADGSRPRPASDPGCQERCCDADPIADAEHLELRTRGAPEGRWYSYADAHGSTVHPPPEARDERFILAEGGANGSARAVRIFGVVARAEFAAVGVAFELIGDADSMDASTHSGIRFAARSGSDEATALMVHIAESRRGPDAARCAECSRAAEIQIEPDWKEYTLRFDELSTPSESGQMASEAPSVARFYGVRFELDTPGAFDLWIDELRFVSCPGSFQPR